MGPALEPSMNNYTQNVLYLNNLSFGSLGMLFKYRLQPDSCSSGNWNKCLLCMTFLAYPTTHP